MQSDDISWLAPMLNKRSIDFMRCLLDLLEAGLRTGRCSANDIQIRNLQEPNVIGGTFKVLHKFGFVHTDERIKTTAIQKHGRRVDVWVLSDSLTAISCVRVLYQTIGNRIASEGHIAYKQGELL